MSNWDLVMPGGGLTAVGMAGIVLSYSGIAHTFIDGMHALSGLLFFVGLISSLSAGPRMISGPITGYRSDRWGRKPLIMIGAIGHGTVLVLQAFSTNFFQYAVLEVFAGLAIAFWVVSSGVLVADVTNPGNRGTCL